MFPLAFVAGLLQGHWWGFFSWNYVVWPIFFLMNVFIALKGTHFWSLFPCIRSAKNSACLTNFVGLPDLLSSIIGLANVGTLLTSLWRAQRRLGSSWASTHSDQSLCCPHEETLGPLNSYPVSAQRGLIRLGGCPGWSESSLGAQVILLVLSCAGSYLIYIEIFYVLEMY